MFSTPILSDHFKSVFTPLELTFWFSLSLFFFALKDSQLQPPHCHLFVFMLSSVKMFILSFSMMVPLILTLASFLFHCCVFGEHISLQYEQVEPF